MSPRSKKLSEEMREQSRATLIEAGRKVFAEQGYFNCKIADIAQEAGMSHGNLYWYFSGKEELLKAILADGFVKLGDAMSEAAAGPGSGREKFARMLESLFTFADQRADFAKILLALMGNGGDALIQELGFDMSVIGLGYTQSVTAILAQAQVEGEIPADRDPIALTMLFFGLFNGLNLTYGREWLQMPAEFFKQAAFDLVGLQGDDIASEELSAGR